MKKTKWAVCFAAVCLLGSGSGEARHLAESRAEEARAAKAGEMEEARQRAWELSKEADAAREDARAKEEAATQEAPLPRETVPPPKEKKEDASRSETRKSKGAEEMDDANRSLRRYLDRLREKADELLHPAEPNLKVRQTRPMKAWDVDVTDGGGTLLFSDSPEYVDRPGILYTDEVEGAARVLFYHLNRTRRPAKVLLIVENTSARPAKIEITRRGLSKPGEDYLAVGKATQAAYFANEQKREQITLKQGERQFLMAELDKIVLAPEALIYGVADFSASAPVRLWVLFSPAELDPFAYLKIAPLLPKDEHRLRGTFHGMNRTMRAKEAYDPDKDGTVYIPIGDDSADRFLTGLDATDGSLVTNYGNYGVLYRLDVPIEGRRPLRAMLNPIGGVYAGVMRVQAAGGGGAPGVPPTLCGRLFCYGCHKPCPPRCAASSLATASQTPSPCVVTRPS